MAADPDDVDRDALAQRLADAVERRAALDEGIGVLRWWGGRSAGQTRQDLIEDFGVDGQDAEAARVAAIVNAQADNRTDPEWD